MSTPSVSQISESIPALPLVNVALRDLKRAIIRCQLTPGSRLKVDTLSQNLRLSSSPIREALNRLAQEGIVDATENRGFWVSKISVEGFQDIVRMRCLLEGEALRESILRGGMSGTPMSSRHSIDWL